MYSRHGNPPHLTPDLVKGIPQIQGLHVPIAELMSLPGSDIMKKYGKGIHKFTNLEGFRIFFSARDPLYNEFGILALCVGLADVSSILGYTRVAKSNHVSQVLRIIRTFLSKPHMERKSWMSRIS